MRKNNDLYPSPEFCDKTAEEQLEEFMDECPVTADAYINFYGAYYSVMRKILPTSKDVLIWMAFNCEPDKGRVFIQSLTRDRLLRELGISLVTYFKCLRDLRDHDAIRGFNAIYYINPRFVWRGTNKRRLIFMSQYPYIQSDRARRK